jgi:hemerythrin
MRQGGAAEELAGVVEFLDQYVSTHFCTEEKFMTTHSYPGYSLHRSKHLWFAAEFSRIREKIQTSGPTPDNVVLANHLLISWFSNHVRTHDRLLGKFLQETKARQIPSRQNDQSDNRDREQQCADHPPP